MPRLPSEGETVTVAHLRSITDEDAAAQLRDPVLWAYMLRDPTGAVYSHGHGKTRKECEERAITHAAECAEEAAGEFQGYGFGHTPSEARACAWVTVWWPECDLRAVPRVVPEGWTFEIYSLVRRTTQHTAT